MIDANTAKAAPPWSKVQEWWKDIEDELLVNRREAVMNEAFDRGDQHVTWSTKARQATIRQLEGLDDRLNRTRVNKVRARRRAITARLTSSPMSLEVRPSTANDDGLRSQRLAEHVLASMAGPEGDDWESVRAQEVTAALFGGISAVAWEWDPKITTPPVAPGPNGQTPTDPVTGLALPCGGLRLSALNVHEFGLEAGSRRQEDARFWIREYGAPPTQVQAIYGLDKPPIADASAIMAPMARLLSNATRGDRLTAVTILTKRPTPGEPGCVAHYVNGRCVSYSPWPYPHDWLNLYVFRCDDPRTNTYITDPWWSDLRQPQASYNEVRQAIRAHVRRAANARIIVPTGGVELDAFSDQAGEVVEFDEEPKWMAPPEVARWLVGEVDRIDNEINDLAGSPDIARGVAPGDRNSGAALALLAEKADGPLGPFAQDQARGWSRIATSAMRTLRHHLPPDQQRLSTTYGATTGVPFVRSWSKTDIDANIVVSVPLESVMPKSQTALRASLIEMSQTFPTVFEGIDGRTLAKVTGLSSLRDMLSNLDHDEAFAEWENELMLAGDPVTPDEWHNHGVHIARHERVRSSSTYELATPEVRSVYDDHIEAHHRLREEQAELAAARTAAAGVQPQPQPQVEPEPQPQEAPEALPPGVMNDQPLA